MKLPFPLKRRSLNVAPDLRPSTPRFTTGYVIEVVAYSDIGNSITLTDETGIPLTVPYSSGLTYYVVNVRDTSHYNNNIKGIEYLIAWLHNGRLRDRWDPLHDTRGQIVRTLFVYNTIEEMLSCNDDAARRIAAEMEGRNRYSEGAGRFGWH